MSKKLIPLVTGALLLLSTVLTACGTTAATSGQSKSVGTVTLYTADGAENYYAKVLPEFEKKYGAKVNVVTDGSGAVVNRLTVEKDSPKADVVVTMPPFVQTAVQQGLLAPYNSPEAAAIPDTRKDKDGYWETFIDDYICFIYNPQLTKNPPSTFADLLNPAFKGQIAYSNPLTAGDGMGFLIMLDKVMGEEKAFAFMKQLEPGVKFHTKGTGYLDVLASRGEIKVANGDLQMDLDDKVDGGLSIQPLFLKPDANSAPVTFEDPYVIGLVKNSPNPQGGKDLIDFLLSKDAQSQIYDIFGLPARNDVPVQGDRATQVQSAIAGVQVLPVDWNQILANQDNWKNKWQTEVVNPYGKQSTVVAPKS